MDVNVCVSGWWMKHFPWPDTKHVVQLAERLASEWPRGLVQTVDPPGHVQLNGYCVSAASSAMPWQRHGHPADLFCPLLSVKLTPMDFSFVACAQSMHLLLLPRRGPWISTFPCVCSFTSFVFTNLSPLPALVKPQCPLSCLHHSLSLSLHCLVCNSPASSFLYPLLVFPVCGMGDSWSKQRWTRRTAFSLILCISFAHWCLLFSSLRFPLLGLAHFKAMACLDMLQRELRAIWSLWEKLGQKPNPSMTKG